MAFLLGEGTAVEWLRSNADPSLTATIWGLPASSLEASRTRLERHLSQLEGLTLPYQVIVSTRDDRRRNAIVRSHVMTVTNGRYLAHRIDRVLYVSTAPYAFFQMASELDDDKLLFLGYELCGRFGIASGGIFPRTQACTPQALEHFAKAAPSTRG